MQEQAFVCIAAAGAIILLYLMSYPLFVLRYTKLRNATCTTGSHS